MKRTISHKLSLIAAAALLGVPAAALAAFVSGSQCGTTPPGPSCLGAYGATLTNEVIELPPDGVLHYSTFTVPTGKTVTFKKNAANTPVTILASDNVTINGTVSVNAQGAPTNSGIAGDGVLGDDGKPGTGGPGGFDGGAGGVGPMNGGTDGAAGGGGQGPGGGQTYSGRWGDGRGIAGGGGGFNGAGGSGWNNLAVGGASYGQWTLLPLIGGSGGGGGSAGATFSGAGGGGGGGAILIASSGTFYISGYITADGGAGGSSSGTYCGGAGAGGSGGAIRIVAEKVDRGGAGYLYARGGGGAGDCLGSGGGGANGYIRMESNVITNWNTGYSNPGYSYTAPGKLFVPNNPTLTIASVNGVAVPANPAGVADITLAENTAMPVSVVVNATNIPTTTSVKIYLIRTNGTRSEVPSSPALAGTDAASSATASVTFQPGNTTIMASVTYTVTELIAMTLPKFNGEYVAKMRVETEIGGGSKTIYITASGKEFTADGQAMKKAA